MKYRTVFPKPHTFLVVVHVVDGEQAIRNTGVAFDNGADGVFLIGHDIPEHMFVLYCSSVLKTFPEKWIGINFLRESDNLKAYLKAAALKASGLWFDDAGYRENSDDPAENLNAVHNWAKNTNNELLTFGGVAFKYISPAVEDPALAAKLCEPYLDVVTTSGNGTGSAPDVGKIIAMSEALEDTPLAIASGISPENVSKFKPYVGCFLVASSLSVDGNENELNPDRVKLLSEIIAE